MEVESEGALSAGETTETNNTPTTEVSAQPDAVASPAQGAVEGVEGEVPAKPAYTPNYKFKYLDAKQNAKLEKEFDDFIKGSIKDSDTEKKVRELYEKAYGLDHTKSGREKLRGELETVRGEHSETKRGINILTNFLNQGDFQSFFEALKIPEDKVLKYALDRVSYRELPPEKRAEYDQMRSAQQRAAYLSEENTRLAAEYTNMQVQTRSQQLESTLANPQVAGIAEEYDARRGHGAFRNEVVKVGQYYWAIHKQDIPVDQAVNEVLQMLGGMPKSAAHAVAPQSFDPNQGAVPGAAPIASQASEKKPVIPNIQGRGTSPAKRIPKSIEDLKKLAREAS
jgi:hypothetical protein